MRLEGFEITLRIDDEEIDTAAICAEVYPIISDLLEKFYGAWYEEEDSRKNTIGSRTFYEWSAYAIDHKNERVVAVDITESIDLSDREVRITASTREDLDKEELEWLLEKAEELENYDDAELIRKILSS